MSDETTPSSKATAAGGPSRRRFLVGGAAAGAATLVPTTSAAAAPGDDGELGDLTRTPATAARTVDEAVAARRHTRVGMGYQTWFSERVYQFETSPAVPVLGRYRSDDPRVIRQHFEWLRWAGVDFLFIDWSNNLNANWENGTAESIIEGTDAVLKQLVAQRRGRRLQFALLLGLDGGEVGTPHFLEQIDLIKERYLADERIRNLFLEHDGKPLIAIYNGARTTEPPEWDDEDFTVRYLGAFREIVLNPGGQWSWKDRVPFANGIETPVSQFADGDLGGWTATGGWKVDELTLQVSFDKTTTVLCANTDPGEGSTQQAGTLTSPPFTITEPVLSFNAIGTDMMARDPLPSVEGRNVFVLRDADTREILRHASPPGDPAHFHVRQWSVRDLIGRRVVFEAINNNTFAYPLGWIGFDRLFQQRAEQLVVSPAQAGNQAPGAYTNWDAKPRNHGATMVEGMQTAFDLEPEILQFTAWNEFGAPDQFGVSRSGDMEPTKISERKGAKSDGWGYYYLDLMHEVIDQYRAGGEVPKLSLDTTYP